MSKKIKRLEEELLDLHAELSDLETAYDNLEKEFLKKTSELRLYNLSTTSKRPFKNYAGSISFDFWPPRDWFRFDVSRWNPGKYFQITVGPLRFDFYAE